MTDLASLLRDLRDLECTGQGTPGTPGSPLVAGAPLASVQVADMPAAKPAPETTSPGMGLVCHDCGRSTVVALVTDYGARYCRDCITFPPKRVPAPRTPTDLELEQPGQPMLGHSPADGVSLDLKLFGNGNGHADARRPTKKGPQ